MERTIALPFPEALAGVLEEIRETAGWLWARGWAERNAGNVSVDVTDLLAGPVVGEGRLVHADIPDEGLAGRALLVSATGSRFRDVARGRGNGLLLIRIAGDGYEVLSAGTDVRAGVTSELVSHQRIHARLAASGSGHRAVLHTHPTNLIALNHMPQGGDARFLTRALWSIMPEVRVFVADGVGVAPYCLPGGRALADATIDALERHRVVVWDKHGCVAVERDVMEAFDLIDTLDKAAAVYLRCLAAGAAPRGLTDEELAALGALARELGRTP